MLHATLPVLHARSNDDEPGTFEAVVSTFNTRVKGTFYDQMLKTGCFSRSLRDRGLPACVWAHDWDTPPIGVTFEGEEIAEGLRIRGRFFVADDEDSPKAREVYTAMRAVGGDGRNVLREFSIGFDIVEAEWEVHDEEEVLVITDTHLYEYGPCLVGRNVSRLLDVHGPDRRSEPQTEEQSVLTRFPRPRSTHQHTHRTRVLDLARPRHISPKEA